MKVVLMTMFVVALTAAQDKYPSTNDNFDISEVLSNDRLLNSYAKCLINKGPCIPEVRAVKQRLPEALETRCAKCTEMQKQTSKKLVQEVRSRHPKLWNELVAYYDPSGKHQEAFQDFLKP